MLHPIVAQMKPSREQEPAILDSGQDVVVTAGAGAGKTRTLVARYLRLLSESVRLRSIVAITFTEKAAREMRNRVRQQMDDYLRNADIAPEEKARWQTLYGELDSARIGTIHGLCAEIVRGHPAELGIDPRFSVLEEGRTEILRGQALEEALSWAANDPQAVALFALLGEQPLRQTVGDLLSRRMDAEEAFRHMPADTLGHWQATLEQRQRVAVAALRGRPEWVEELDYLRSSQPIDPSDLLAIQQQAALFAAAAPPEPLADCLARLKGLSAIKLTGGKGKAWPGGAEQVKEIKAALSDLRDLWKEHSGLLQLTLNGLDEQLAGAMPLLQALYERAAERYQALKDERSSLDFDDLEGRALELLRDHSDVRARWQREVRAILVDEYQDTNARQNQLVDLLNGGEGKLFVVGDAKQSIYAFRGADVAVFRQLRQRAQQRKGLTRELRVTYRAHESLVEGLNALLKPVLGECEDPARPWVEPFAPLQAARQRKRYPPDGGGNGDEDGHVPDIELHLGLGSKTKGALGLAADALAVRLRELVEGRQLIIQEHERARRAEYGDIAVLCRASTAFAAYEDAFDRAGLPFLTVAGRGFYDRPEIRDLLNILAAVADPTDDLALVGALRSPVLALSDAALYQLRSQQLQTTPELSFWEALQSDPLHSGSLTFPSDESPAQAERLQTALGLIGRLHKNAGRMAVADLLKEFLDETDYRAALILAGQSRAARNVNKLLSDAVGSAGAAGSGIISIGEFLELIAELRESGAREGEARSTSEGAIQIMSVHAAKGLEFPIVVIGDVTYAPRPHKPLLLDPELGVLVPLHDAEDEDKMVPTCYTLGEMAARDKDLAENARLLYVAATRASERLIFSGCVSPRRKPEGWLDRMDSLKAAGLAMPDCDLENPSGRAIPLPLQMGEIPVACTFYEPGWEVGASDVLASDALAPASVAPRQQRVVSLPLLAPLSQDVPSDETVTPERVWRVTPRQDQPYAPGWVIGKLVHQALAAWRFPDDAYKKWAEVMARGLGLVDNEQIAHAVQRSRRLVLRFRQHELWQEMERAERRYHEVPYSLTIDGQAQSGTIDVLYCQGDTWTVVEFKSDPLKTQDELPTFVDEKGYIAQAEKYERAVEALLGVKPIIKLCMLDCEKQVVICDPRTLDGTGQERGEASDAQQENVAAE